MTTASTDVPGDALAVWLLAVGQTLIYVGTLYSFPALLPDLEAGTGWTKTALAAGPTVAFLLTALIAPFAGRLVDRGWGGEMLIFGPVLAAIGIAALGFARSPTEWLLAWLVIGAAQAVCVYETCFSFLIRRLGTGARAAITRVTLVAGFASTLTFPLGLWLGRDLGGQGAMVVFAAIVLFGVVPVNFVAVQRLRRLARSDGPRVAVDEKGSLRVAMRRVEFWVICAAIAAIGLNHGILITHVLALFADRGVGSAVAATAAACIGPAQVAGRLALLFAGARVSTAQASFLAFLSILVAGGLLWLAGAAPGLIFAFALLQGAGAGMLSILKPVLIAEVLGRRGFGAISGAIAVPAILASAAAPLAGAALLSLGGPDMVYAACFGLAVLALASGLWIVRRTEAA